MTCTRRAKDPEAVARLYSKINGHEIAPVYDGGVTTYYVQHDHTTAGAITVLRVAPETWNIHLSVYPRSLPGRVIKQAVLDVLDTLPKGESILVWVPRINRPVGHLAISTGFRRIGTTKELVLYTKEL